MLTVYLSVLLPATESPMAEGLAFRYVNNSRSQRVLTDCRNSDGGGVSLSDMPTAVSLSVQLPATENPEMVGLASPRHANDVDLVIHLPT